MSEHRNPASTKYPDRVWYRSQWRTPEQVDRLREWQRDYDKGRFNAESWRQKACEVCGWDEAACDVHHIHGREAGNDPSNLITLCPNHHRIADRDRIAGVISPFINHLRLTVAA